MLENTADTEEQEGHLHAIQFGSPVVGQGDRSKAGRPDLTCTAWGATEEVLGQPGSQSELAGTQVGCAPAQRCPSLCAGMFSAQVIEGGVIPWWAALATRWTIR